MKSIFNLLILVFLVTACGSKKHFTSRKYTTGRYVSNIAHKQKVPKHMKRDSENEGNYVLEAKGSEFALEFESEKKTFEPYIQKTIKKTRKNSNTFLERSSFTRASENNKERINNEESILKPNNEGPSSKKSVSSVYLSALAITVSVVGFILTILTGEYLFLIFCAIGLAIGVLGLVMGLFGIKNYRAERNRGNKRNSNLVLGIIGTALGGAAIIAAIYFAFFGVLFSSLDM